MTDRVLTKLEEAIGKRILMWESWAFRGPTELRVLEVSPSRQHVLVQYSATGMRSWIMNDPHVNVEELPETEAPRHD